MGDSTSSAAGPDSSEPPSPPTVVEAGYQAWLWLDERVAGYPTVARRQLGHRTLDAILDALTATTEASYLRPGPARVRLLELAARRLTLSRLLLRGARERRYLSVGQHEHAMRLLDAWGRQLGGWLKRERQRASGGRPR